jgi:hypothetical protein
MSSVQAHHQANKEIVEDDSAVTLLHHLESERGRLYTEAEYQEMRRAIIDELTEGARCRPFTLFTFAMVGLLLLTMLIVGLLTASGNTIADFALAIVSGLALLSAGYYFWTHLQGIRSDALRSLDERLAELEALRSERLVSPEEYETIHSRILIARQKNRGA